MVPLVPLIDRPRREYLVILAGVINGYRGAFFDLFIGSGEEWNLQSTVLLRAPGVTMPRFQPWARHTCSRAPSRFLENVRRERWTIEGLGDALVVYRWGRRVQAGRLGTYVDRAAELGAEMFSLCGVERGSPDSRQGW
jgi:hypothetical protein